MAIKTRTLFGVQFPEAWPDHRCLLWLYLVSPGMTKDPFWRPDIEGRPETYTCDGNPAPNPYTGQGRFQHVQQLTQMFFPKAFEWNDWSLELVRIANENNRIAVSGCGTSGKSTAFGLDAFWFYAAAPLDTAVILVSTTLESAKKRIWKEVSRFYGAFSLAAGGYRDATMGQSPRPYISPYRPDQRNKRDEAHGIYVSALQRKSDTDEEMEFIKGFHPRRIYVIADEMDSLRQHGKALRRVFDENLASGTIEAKFAVLGNDPSLFNELGEIMQRELGKPLTLADKSWTSVHGYSCLRLDAWDSPNIRDNNKWTGLIRQEDIDRITKNGAEMNTPGVWVQLHGLHPTEGAENTVLSEAMFVRGNCRDQILWQGSITKCGCLDPSFGGDNCVLRRFDYGVCTDGKLRVYWHAPIYLPIDASNRNTPPEYQVAYACMAFCKSQEILPQNFIGDSTGTTGGCIAVMRREWSPAVNECSFAGLPSDMIVSDENPVPAKDYYDRKVTELWFSFREFVNADMVRGLDNKTAAQFCSRHFEIRARKYRVETKEDMKTRGLDSPDESDCCVTGIQLLRERGINAEIVTQVKLQSLEFLQREEMAQDFDSGATYQEDFSVAEYD